MFIIMSFSIAAASECTVSGAKVTKVQQYKDGHVFVYFDTNTNCDCTISNRLAFKNETTVVSQTIESTTTTIEQNREKLFMSAALAAMTSGKNISATGEDRDSNGNCPIHGNTAELSGMTIY